MPRIQLTNGLCVANFSSPHAFEFSDGSVLPGCSEERTLALILVPLETNKRSPCGRWTDIDFEFTLPVVTKAVMLTSAEEEVDVILVPLPMLLCIKEFEWFGNDDVRGKMRCIRMTDRISKRIHIDRFCI